MSKHIGIGKATRLARIGEMVSVSINGTTITAKVAKNLSSTKVLILFDGRTYHAYPESQRTMLKNSRTVLAKHERRKQYSKVTISTAILFEVANYSRDFPRENDSHSYYVSVDGSEPRHILTAPIRIRIPILGQSGSDLVTINPIYDSTLTYFGRGRYRGSIKYGLRQIRREIGGNFYTINFYTNMVVFTESSIRTYGLFGDIPPAPEDWQDIRVRDMFVGSYTDQRFLYDSLRGTAAQGGDRDYIRSLFIGNVGDIYSIHPCFWGGLVIGVGSLGLSETFLRQGTEVDSIHYNIDMKNQIIFAVNPDLITSFDQYTTTGVSLQIQASNYRRISSEEHIFYDSCAMSRRNIDGSLYSDYIFPKIEIPPGSIVGHNIAGFVTWSNYRYA